jgi:4-alpha-glucanotransferase
VTLVDDSYVDAFNERRSIDPDVRAAVLAAMGLEDGEEPVDTGALVGRPGGRLAVAGEVVLEDGTTLGHRTSLPPDVPIGYHALHTDDGRELLLLVGPGRCHLPSGLREWGWAVQLASARSASSWGVGDLGDLRRLGAWSAEAGAGFLAVSPLGAPNPTPHPDPSPYYPSTRRFGNPIHLDLGTLLAESPADAIVDDGVLARVAALNRATVIDRSAVLGLKRAVLERVWDAGIGEGRAVLDAWRAERGEALERWAIFNVLSERHGPGWRSWPAELHDPGAPSVLRVAAEEPERVAFHAWVQWWFDRQLAAASAPIRRIADMPVGVDPGGFDAWDSQGQLALGATIGAPPDRFNRAGQDWGLPPFVPHRLAAARYRPFIDTIRAQLRHAGGLRIDHVLGLFRLWWVPHGHGPDRGAYVRYPTDELLEIVAIESHAAGAVVIGEDLGTVPPGVRRELRRRNVLSTRLALFERALPSRYPRNAFAAVTTHDLPTVAGAVRRTDLADQEAAGLTPDPDAIELLRGRLFRAAGIPADGVPLDELVVELHRRLAASPSVLVAATLDDALLAERRPNLPGTYGEQRPNWSIPLPEPLERIERDPLVRRVVEALARS